MDKSYYNGIIDRFVANPTKENFQAIGKMLYEFQDKMEARMRNRASISDYEYRVMEDIQNRVQRVFKEMGLD